MNARTLFKKEHFWLWGTLTLGIILRAFQFDNWSLSNDELSALNRLNYSSLSELIAKGIRPDSHPALTQIFLFYWTKLFGTSAFALRLPFLLLGIGSLFYFKKIASVILNQRASLFALSIFAVSQFFVLYSQIARPYILGLFFTLAFTYYWSQLLFKSAQKIRGILFVLTAFLGVISHYLATFSILLIYLSGFLFLAGKNRTLYLILGISILILFSPHLLITIEQLGHKGLAWLPVPKADFIWKFLEFCFNDSIFFMIIFALSFLMFLFSANYESRKKNLIRLVLFLLFAIPFFTTYLYSIFVGSIIQYSILIFSFPFLLLFVASFIRKDFSIKLLLPISLSLIFFGTKALVIDLDFYNKKPFANFKAVVRHIVDWNKELAENAVLNFANSNNPDYFRHYFEQMEDSVPIAIPTFDDESKVAHARDLIQNTSKPYVLIAFGNTPVPKEVHEFTKQKFPKIIKQKRYFNSEAILYGKFQNPEKARNITFQTSADEFAANKKWSVDENLVQTHVFHTDSMAYFISSQTEFALTYRDNIKNVFLKNQKFLTISAFLKTKEQSNLKLVCSIERDGKNIYWRGTDSKPYAKNNQWFQMLYVLEKTPEINEQDILSIYFWNPEKSRYWIDDFKITLFEDSDYNYYEVP